MGSKDEAKTPEIIRSANNTTAEADNAAVVYRIYDRHTPGSAAAFALVSARAGAGTTFCAINIAKSMHHLLGDLSVLIVDANLQHGELSEMVGAPKKGWLNWLRDSEHYSLQDAISSCVAHPEISILPIGRRPGQKGKHRTLLLFDALSELKADFDFILIDCPPFFGDRLAPRFCASADGVIVVIEAEKTRKSAAKTMVTELRAAGSEILGAVLNKRHYPIPDWIYDRLF